MTQENTFYHEVPIEAIAQQGTCPVATPLTTTEKLILAVKKNGMLLEFIKKEDQTVEICETAVKQNWEALQYVEKQTVAICLIAVEQNFRAIRYVNKQTPEICKVVVKHDGMAIEWVCLSCQTPDVCLAAVEQNWKAINLVPLTCCSPELWCAVVRQNPVMIRKVRPEHLTPDVILAAAGI